ncbi:DUF2306 domain-containing protein [Sphingobacterium spiritivorum]|uniref:DUF2306 domain-containing protein n=1 Tax=Sphingobacterium spiritivorum TaxID=258 RepID=UPI00191A264E|nr:DUF2306 domain-containing protein [Sphingobacterium spiritivorum]QQT25908.1 DUF2306 domain-containing protein [Sphingobacterium spiritivorum]
MFRKVLFILFCVLSLVIGLYPLMYAFVEPKYTFLGTKTPEILHNIIWKAAFMTHILFGGIALFIGWRQFGAKFRNNYMRLHKNIGKIYVGCVVLSSISGIYMGFYANGGLISSTGFISLGIIWLLTTCFALYQIRKGNITKHQQLMTYSYACTFAAVTLRLWFPSLIALTGDPVNSYLAVAWLCWVPNVIAAFFINKLNTKNNIPAIVS